MPWIDDARKLSEPVHVQAVDTHYFRLSIDRSLRTVFDSTIELIKELGTSSKLARNYFEYFGKQ